MGSRGNDDGWVELGRTRWWVPLVGSSPLVAVLPVYTLNLPAIFWPDLPVGWTVIITVGFATATFGVLIGILRLVNPHAFVNVAASLVRAGRKQARFSEVTSAQLFPGTAKRHRSLLLVLRAENKLRASILLRDAQQRTLAPEITALTLELVRQSNIAMPVSPDDPKGRFARFNFPHNVTKEEAAELVAHPPTPADTLPIPYV
jgi:hypothetical protein